QASTELQKTISFVPPAWQRGPLPVLHYSHSVQLHLSSRPGRAAQRLPGPLSRARRTRGSVVDEANEAFFARVLLLSVYASPFSRIMILCTPLLTGIQADTSVGQLQAASFLTP